MESLINHEGTIVEYYGSICPNWTRNHTSDETHFRTECIMTGSNQQLLQAKIPSTTPDTCPECTVPLDEQYSVITWIPGERVTTADALTMITETQGYITLRFTRQNEPLSEFCKEYLPSDEPVYVIWDDDELTATTTTENTPALTITHAVLDEFTTHYPVEPVKLSDTPFKTRQFFS